MKNPGIIEKLRNEEKASFLRLSPAERVFTMEERLYEIIAIKARAERVTEGEIYKRYLERDKKTPSGNIMIGDTRLPRPS